MTTAEHFAEEMTVSEAVRLLWSQKVVIAVLFCLGLLLIYPTMTMFPGTTTRVVSLNVYPSGTPIDTVEDIKSQLITTLARSGFAATPTDMGVQIDVPYNAETLAAADAKYREIEKAVADYQNVLLEKVSNGRATLDRYEPSEGTVAIDLRYRSFEDGVANGTIVPVQVTKADVDTRKKSLIKTAIGLPVLSLLIGVFIAWVLALIQRGKTA